jgi:hypothetical protein
VTGPPPNDGTAPGILSEKALSLGKDAARLNTALRDLIAHIDPVPPGDAASVGPGGGVSGRDQPDGRGASNSDATHTGRYQSAMIEAACRAYHGFAWEIMPEDAAALLRQHAECERRGDPEEAPDTHRHAERERMRRALDAVMRASRAGTAPGATPRASPDAPRSAESGPAANAKGLATADVERLQTAAMQLLGALAAYEGAIEAAGLRGGEG